VGRTLSEGCIMWAWEIFGDYLLIDRLGEGGLSEVWRARCQDREVALKRFKSKDFSPPSVWQELPERLQHPNLVATYRLGTEQHRHFAELALVEGSSLAAVLEAQDRKQLQLSTEIAIYIIQEIARGLAHLHAQALVHCDVSPQNILLSVEGEVFLSDFELTRHQNTNPTPALGKPRYMSLPQREGAAAQPTWDVFSLGVVFWELLTGRPLMSGQISEEVEKIQQGQLPPPSSHNQSIRSELDMLCLDMLGQQLTAQEITTRIPPDQAAKTALAGLIREHFPPRCKIPPRLSAVGSLTLPTTPAVTTAQKTEALVSIPMPLTLSQQTQALASTQPTVKAVHRELEEVSAPTKPLPVVQPVALASTTETPRNAPLALAQEPAKPFVPDFRRFDVPQEPVLRPIRIVPVQEEEEEEEEEESRPMFDVQEEGGSLLVWVGALAVLLAILIAGFFLLLR
jgi:serine/threonine protein kinase